jgi:hypothetical protein
MLLTDIQAHVPLIQAAMIAAEKAEIAKFGSVLPETTALHTALYTGVTILASHFNTDAAGLGVSPDSGGGSK